MAASKIRKKFGEDRTSSGDKLADRWTDTVITIFAVSLQVT